MKRQSISFIFLLFITTFLHAQEFIQGVVLDSMTSEPIGFVNIGSLENPNGTVSTEDGKFKFKKRKGDETIRLSSIGYKSKTISLEEFKGVEQVFLKPVSYSIEPINIEAKQFGKLKRVGTKVKSKTNTLAWGNSEYLGLEIGVPIKIKKESYLKSAHFGVLKVSTGSTLLRVNIYEFKNGKVGKNLMPKNLFVQSKDLVNYSAIDLSELNIVVDHDVILALETVEKENKLEEFYLAFGMKVRLKGNVYSREASQAKFKRTAGEKLTKIGFYLKVKEVK